MGRSRYAGNKIIDGNHYGTWVDPTVRYQFAPDILDGVTCVDHVLHAGERFDTIAQRYYGDEELWWVITLANRIQDPFTVPIGTLLKIPLNARQILDKVQR